MPTRKKRCSASHRWHALCDFIPTFASRQHGSVAVRFIRRGGAGRAGADDAELASDVDDSDGEKLAGWLEGAGTSISWNIFLSTAGGADVSRLVKRFLPPGNVAELYQHYIAVSKMTSDAVPASPGSQLRSRRGM